MECPICKSILNICGSECYPESGVEIECSNLECEYEGPVLIYNKRTDKLKQALTQAFNVLEGNRNEQ